MDIKLKSKLFLRAAAYVMSAVMLLAIAAACNRDNDGSIYVPPEFIYVPQTIPMPEDMANIYTFASVHDKLYFANSAEEAVFIVKTPEGEDFNGYKQTAAIYSMNFDGSGLAKLDNYTPPGERPDDDAFGGSYINSIIPGGDGTLWVVENWHYYGYELPDDYNPEFMYPWEMYIDYGNGRTVRRLDSTGAELQTLDLTGISEGQEYFYLNAFGVDGAGRLYLSVEDWEKGGVVIYVLSSSGELQFTIDSADYFNQFYSMPDGSLAIAGDSTDEEGNWVRVLKTIDYASRSISDGEKLPSVGWNIHPGGGEYDFLINDYNNIYGFNLGDEEAEKLLSWLDIDILNNGIGTLMMLPDGRIVCTNYVWDRVTYESGYELLVLTKTPYSELPKKTVLTLATLGSYDLRESVVKFNRANPEYRIQILDYSEYNNEKDGWDAGLKKLSTEIIAGRLPDILDVSRMPYKEYAARGLLADLYPLIDSDPDFSRDDFVDGAYSAAEINGSLYQLFSSFYVQTLIGHPSIVGTDMGWNMDEFRAVLRDNPGADMPLGQWLTKNSFLQAAISYSIDEYIDWSKGTVRFDTPDFIQLLESADTFPEEPDREKIDWDEYYRNYVSEEEAIATGRQLMVQMTVYDFSSILWYKSLFGGEITYKGFPNENRNGNSLGLNSSLALVNKSKNKDAAWDFMRTMLDKDWQISYTWGMPTNKAAFEQRVSDALSQDYGYYYRTVAVRPSPGGIVDDGGFAEPEPLVLTQADVEQIKTLIRNASGTSAWNVDQSIWDIISESVNDFFAGSINAQEAARVIQSRLSIYVSERS